jgi:hypothetical protein
LIAGMSRIMAQKTNVPADELESFGRDFCLRKVVRKYNPSRGALSTFATWCLRNAMLDYAIRYKRLIPLTDMGDFDMERALPAANFDWPDERIEELAERIGDDAWVAVRAMLEDRDVQKARREDTRREAAKEVLWRWMEVKMKGALTA